MNKKWNLFSRKKGNKTDSHGTTLANEEIIFQPTVHHDQEPQYRKSNSSLSIENDKLFPVPKHSLDDIGKKRSSATNFGLLPRIADASHEIPDITVVGSNDHTKLRFNTENNQHGVDQHKHDVYSDDGVSFALNKLNTFNQSPLVTAANISRVSPRVAKKLIKPGGINSERPSFVIPTVNNAMGVSISDEYTDPYDAISTTKMKNERSSTDGYLEPYEAQQVYYDATHATPKDTEYFSKSLYDDPWDKTEVSTGTHPNYEDPWDHSDKLQNECKLTQHSQSGDSLAPLSASVAKQKLIRIDPSETHSLQNSPLLHKRLFKSKETEHPLKSGDAQPHADNVSCSKAIDQRLIKAEPSVEELRRSASDINQNDSSRSSSSSRESRYSNTSPSHSPTCTLASGELTRVSSEATRRSSSPHAPLTNSPLRQFHKAKSNSLDVRNGPFPPAVRSGGGKHLSKSASEDQLSQASAHAQYRASPTLDGLTEYEEPWDGSSNLKHIGRDRARHPKISHSRSKSYELGYSSANMFPRHRSSHSFDTPESISEKHTEYESPWDQHDGFPKTHLESMQRYQHHQLELHPSEAISHKDFDPLAPLEKQSWFHGPIIREEANRRLANKVAGSYLVRNSESVPNNYSLSLRTSNDTIHMVISRTRDGFWILGEFSAPFHSIPEMITHYAEHRLKIDDVHHVSLKYPVPD